MDRVKNITEFVVISNLENRALNAGISKAQNWWKNRHNKDSEVAAIAQPVSIPIGETCGRLLLTVIRGQDLHESRFASSSSSVRPCVVLECNQQRFQTSQAETYSSIRNPEWSNNNGPFGFNIFQPNTDRLTVWLQQQDSLRKLTGNEIKTLGTCEITVNQLIGQEQVWIPLRKDNKPVGQILLQIMFLPKDDLPPAYDKI